MQAAHSAHTRVIPSTHWNCISLCCWLNQDQSQTWARSSFVLSTTGWFWTTNLRPGSCIRSDHWRDIKVCLSTVKRVWKDLQQTLYSPTTSICSELLFVKKGEGLTSRVDGTTVIVFGAQMRTLADDAHAPCKPLVRVCKHAHERYCNVQYFIVMYNCTLYDIMFLFLLVLFRSWVGIT